MKTDKQITGLSGILVVNNIVNEYWKSDWQKVDQENDDAIDGIIHIRKKGELTGEVIYTQIKSGEGYKIETKNRPNEFGINVGKDYIESHRPRWNALRGAIILIYIDENKKAYWTNLKSNQSYTSDNNSIILVPRKQRFGNHSKGHFKKFGEFILQDRQLITIEILPQDISYIKINSAFNFSARKFYKEWCHSNIIERINPGIGEVIVNRSGWRHISRSERGFDKILQSWQLLSVAKIIIQKVEKAYQISKQVTTTEDKTEYTLKDIVSLRAKIVFPNRHTSIVQVILRRKKTVNRVYNTINQKVWFYSVYEPRRGMVT